MRARFASGHSGYTYTELVIAVAIVAILARMAVFAYTSSAQKAMRSDAKNALTQDQQALERCYSQYFAYNNGACPATFANSPNNYYTVAISNLSATAYTLTASPRSGTQAAKDTQCTGFIVDQTGTQSVVTTSTGSALYCWTGHS